MRTVLIVIVVGLVVFTGFSFYRARHVFSPGEKKDVKVMESGAKHEVKDLSDGRKSGSLEDSQQENKPRVFRVQTERALPVPADEKYIYRAGSFVEQGQVVEASGGVAIVKPVPEGEVAVVTSAAVPGWRYERFAGFVYDEDGYLESVVTSRAVYKRGRGCDLGSIESLTPERVVVKCVDGSRFYVINGIAKEIGSAPAASAFRPEAGTAADVR